MKFYDTIFSGNPSRKYRDNWPSLPFEDAVVIDASNAVKYCDEHAWNIGDAPSFLPPFDYTWWESSYIPVKWRPGISRIGAFSSVTDCRDSAKHPQSVVVSKFRDSGHEAGEWLCPIGDESTVTTPVSWLVEWSGFVETHGTVGLISPIQGLTIALDDQGHLVESNEGASLLLGRIHPLRVRSYTSDEGHNAVGKIFGFIKGFLMAVGFCHCQNVALVDGDMPPPKIRANQEKKLGAPLIQFKELVIDPNLTRKRPATRAINVGPKAERSLHICRGHFQTYTEEKPMFGKYAGTFWVPAHVRGTEDAGKVFKDYAIKT